MRESFVRSVVVASTLAALAGCAYQEAQTGSDDMGRVPPDPYFFAGPLDGSASGDNTVLLINRAIRRIDVCGLVDPLASAQKIPGFYSWGYHNAVGEHSRDLSSCRLFIQTAQPNGRTRGDSDLLFVGKKSDIPALRDARKDGDLLIAEPEGRPCLAAAPLDLASLPDAPAISPQNQTYLAAESSAAPRSCDQAAAIVVAAKDKAAQRLPHRDERSPTRLALDDPCSLGGPELGRRTAQSSKFDGQTPSCDFLLAAAPQREVRITFVLVAPSEEASWREQTVDGTDVRIAPAQPGGASDCGEAYAVLPEPPLMPIRASGGIAGAADARTPAIRVSGTSVRAQFHSCDALAQIAASAEAKAGT
ncbi:hypothetical protein [Segniliparus rugosus]|uniref:Uncharacterized protein n=1 Tax=Segniliparus rugosus (strain ATCC BAA-974 / DSM 45345 / CCUG 50838 / CIP 108380 / JCM 13579 / CDC 945) TaxID=679197 RepID=E5XUV9_SEGRC|nr:hypothetical protein [Segniliparus rugosus]EFV11795.2 hypothetical protein HMPREF9336_03281 [Segniliparus rugosus ATCC BAA-974]